MPKTTNGRKGASERETRAATRRQALEPQERAQEHRQEEQDVPDGGEGHSREEVARPTQLATQEKEVLVSILNTLPPKKAIKHISFFISITFLKTSAYVLYNRSITPTTYHTHYDCSSMRSFAIIGNTTIECLCSC